MLLVLLTSLAFSTPPDLGRFRIEPWRRSDPTLFLSLFDSAAARNQRLGMFSVRRGGSGELQALDTTLLWSQGGQLAMEQRRHDFEETPQRFSVYTSRLSRSDLTVDSGREFLWQGDSLISESVASTTLVGRMRVYRSTSHQRTIGEGTAYINFDSSVSVRDEGGHLVSNRFCFGWTSTEAGVQRSSGSSCQTDSILWSDGSPRIWWENDSNTSSYSGMSSGSTTRRRTIHHLVWDGTRLLVDSALSTDMEGDSKDSIRVFRCSWKDTLLQSCSDNGAMVVEMRHTPSGRPSYRRSDIDGSTDWWTYDSLGRNVHHRERRHGFDSTDVDSVFFGADPWPRREHRVRCDTNGNSCRPVRTLEHSFAYLDAIGVSGRTHRQDRILGRRSGDILVLTNLPPSRGEIRIVDAGGRRVAESTWSGATARIVLPPASATLFWTASSPDGTAPASGVVPGF